MGLYTDQSYALKQVCYNCHHGSHQKCSGVRYYRRTEGERGKTKCECEGCRVLLMHKERGL